MANQPPFGCPTKQTVVGDYHYSAKQEARIYGVAFRKVMPDGVVVKRVTPTDVRVTE